jgi:dinuclear metal center YbgI/SA1388 family protein
MGVRVGEIVEVLESFVPLRLAEKWDNVGLQVGDGDWEVDTVLVSLNVDGEVVEEAKETGAGLVISHHPLIFGTVKSVTTDREPGCTIMGALRSEIAIYAAHTNADSACGGANDLLAEGLGLIQRRPLRAAEDKAEVKLVTFVPQEDVEAVRKAVCDAGGGIIGEYRDCSFRTKGTGTFFGTEGTEPAVGTKGRLEEVTEWRLEVVIAKGKLPEAMRALLESHPYETPAYDIYPLSSSNYQAGLGRIGILPKPIRAVDLAKRVKKLLALDSVRMTGEANVMVEKVAVCSGGGGDLLGDALGQGAEAYVTGDVKYHAARNATAEGMVVIDAGHGASELPVVRWLAEQLEKKIPEVRFLVSEVDVEPFTEL